MHRARRLAGAVVAMLVFVACGTATQPSTSVPGVTETAAPTGGTAARTSIPTLPPSVINTPPAAPTETLVETFPENSFSNPTHIDNLWLPLTPGTRWVWEGAATVDGVLRPRRVEFAITDLTKVVRGVEAVVGYDLDITDGVLNEAEIVFLAQDDEGNLWHLGQFPAEYEDGILTDAPIWIDGFDDASAGIWMKAEPRYGSTSYSQGYAPTVGWTDRARVFEMGSVTCVPVGCYEDVLVIDEFNRDEPDAHQLKYYAPGIGGVRVGWAGSREEEREELELVSLERLAADEMAVIRAAVLAQDARGYELSPEIYGRLPRMERAAAAD